MKSGQDYMKKASSICLTKASESESTDDNTQLKVCYLYYFIVIHFYFFY